MPLWPQTKQRLSPDKYVPLIAVILLLENIQNIIYFVSDSDELIFLKFICLSLLISTLALVLADGQLYAGVYIDFMGTDSAIFRTLGKHTAMRTDQYNSRWLHGTHNIFEPWRITKTK